MFKSFQDTSALQQFHSFPNLNMQQATSAYGFSGVTFWLDAAYGLNTQTNLGAVSSWQQRVGGGTFVQATAGAQPRLILSDANYNNFPSVENHLNDRQLSASIGLKFNQNTTVAIISKINANDSINGIIGNSSPENCIFDGGNNSGFNGFGFLGSSGISLQGTTESTNARIKILTSTNIIVNGVIETTGSIGNANAELRTLFGGNAAGGTGVPLSSIAEIICFGYSMTSDEAIALSNNINQKYALY
jgi:hypothetical protein